MDFPNLINNQVALLKTDAETGRALDERLDFVINDEQKAYTVFNSYYEAFEGAKTISSSHTNVECVIYGKNREPFFTISAAIMRSFNKDFCAHLQYHLSLTFGNSADEEISHFWCDGVAIPNDLLITRKSVIGAKKIVTMAWIGPDGQEKYEMTINLGEKSLENIIKGESLTDCLPGEDSSEWITLDMQQHTIALQLK
jgi:hypothetical protein